MFCFSLAGRDDSSKERIKKEVFKIMKEYLDDGFNRKHHIVEIEIDELHQEFNTELIDRNFSKPPHKQSARLFF